MSDVVVVGAGPYGLSATAHLRSSGIEEVRVFGDPMSFWRSMPKGMLLRSNRTATSMVDQAGPYSIHAHVDTTGRPMEMPFPLQRFVDYGEWVQRQVAPDADHRLVRVIERNRHGFMLRLADSEVIQARRVVIAAGIADFPHRPAFARTFSPEHVSHTSDHADLSMFSGRSMLVVGGGQSALESASLLHESGATVEVIVRAPMIHWLHGGTYHRLLGRYSKLVYAPTDVGPLGLSRLVGATDFFRRLPRGIQGPIARRSIRPAGAAWLRPRLADVPITLGRQVRSARVKDDRLSVVLDDGSTRVVDHILLGTGYQVDIARYPFLSPDLISSIDRVGGYPILRDGLESSVRGLHFLGAPAAWSYGPTMRFISGSWYAGRALTRVVCSARDSRASKRVHAN